MRMRSVAVMLAVGCSTDVKISAQAQCDGVLQSEEETVDSPFDQDGDGFFDRANPDCAANYDLADLDCDDGDPAVNPGAGEVVCDLIDNDCDEETPDSTDADEDGYTDCEECDDTNAAVHPGQAEEICNGMDDDCDEETPDAIDADQDGWSECEDCNDFNEEISPGELEITCNGIDDDCDEKTADEEDLDGDGSYSCSDCDDDDELRSPELEETCDDEVDNDCDDDIDEGCSYTGIWTLDRFVQYQCASFFGIYLVDIAFSQLYIQDLGTSVTVAPTSGGSQPGTTYGTFTSDTTLATTNTLTGSCNEIYSFAGTFTDPDTFVGSFQAEFVGSGCMDCTDQSITFSATRK